MRVSTIWIGLSLLASGLLGARRAGAEEITPWVGRGMMLGGGQMFMVLSTGANVGARAASLLDATLSLGLGLTPRLGLDGALGTISVGGAGYHGPQLGVWAGLVDTPPFELDVTTHATFLTGDPRAPVTLEPGLQSISRLEVLRVDVGVYLPIAIGGPGPTGLRVPITAGVQLGSPRLAATLASGVSLADARDASTLSVPITLAVSYSTKLEGGGAVALSPSVSWPAVIGPPASTVIGFLVAVVSP